MPRHVPDELALFPAADRRRRRPPRRRSPIGCGPTPSTISWGTRSCSAPGKPLREAIEQGAISSMVLWGPPGLRQDDARAPARPLHRQGIRDVQRRDRGRAARARDHSRGRAAPAGRRTRHDSLLRRDPPLQPRAAGCVLAVRRGRRHHADRRDDRESVVRAELGPVVAPARVRARAARARSARGDRRARAAAARSPRTATCPRYRPRRPSSSCATPTATHAAR